MRWDVVVVGSGLAGLECCGRLAAAGVRVLLVDVKVDVGRDVHTTGIFVRRTLEDFALPEDLLGPPIRRVALHSPRGRVLELESPCDEFRIGRMAELYRRKLREAMAAGAEWSPGTRLVGLDRSGGGWRLSLRTGRRPWAAEATLVVGADGPRSRTARAAGLSRNTRFLAGVEEVYRGVPAAGPPVLHCYLDPRLAPGYIGWVTQDGEEVHVGVAGHAERFRPVVALGEMLERAGRSFDLTRAERTEARGGVIPVGGVLERISGDDVLLLGDAAGAVSPLTGGGLDPALRLSAFAARVILARLESGDASVLRCYDGRAFRRRFRSRLLLRSALTRLEHPLLSELVVGAARLPGARSFAAGVFFGRGSFPDADEVGLAVPLSPPPVERRVDGGSWLGVSRASGAAANR